MLERGPPAGVTGGGKVKMQETIAYVALQRLQSRYADIVTRRNWPELHDVMRADCVLTVDMIDREIEFDGPQAIGDFIASRKSSHKGSSQTLSALKSAAMRRLLASFLLLETIGAPAYPRINNAAPVRVAISITASGLNLPA